MKKDIVEEIMDEIKGEELQKSFEELQKKHNFLSDLQLEEKRIKDIVKKFHCTREVAKDSTIVFFYQPDKNEKIITVGYTAYVRTEGFPTGEFRELRFSDINEAIKKVYRLIRNYMKNGYKVKTYNLDIYVPKGKYWERELDLKING